MEPDGRGPWSGRRRGDRPHDSARDRAVAHRSDARVCDRDLCRSIRDVDPWRRLPRPVRGDRRSFRSRVLGGRAGLPRCKPIGGRDRRAGERGAQCHGSARPCDAGHRLSWRQRRHGPLPVRSADCCAVAAHRRLSPRGQAPSGTFVHTEYFARSRPGRACLHGRLVPGWPSLPGGGALDDPRHGPLLVRRVRGLRSGPPTAFTGSTVAIAKRSASDAAAHARPRCHFKASSKRRSSEGLLYSNATLRTRRFLQVNVTRKDCVSCSGANRVRNRGIRNLLSSAGAASVMRSPQTRPRCSCRLRLNSAGSRRIA